MSGNYDDICQRILDSLKTANDYNTWKDAKQKYIRDNRQWKNKSDFMDWLVYKKIIAITKCKGLVPKGDCASDDNMAFKNASINLDHIESILDDKLIEHFNTYFYDTQIDIWHIEFFLYVVDSVRFFKKSRFSTDAKEYKREVDQLKKQADKMQYFSPTQLRIKIPQLPQDVIYPMVKRFKRYGLDDQNIRYFYDFFEDRKRLPRKTKSYQERLALWDKIVYSERIKSTHAYTLGMQIASETIHWYQPDSSKSYRLTPKKT